MSVKILFLGEFSMEEHVRSNFFRVSGWARFTVAKTGKKEGRFRRIICRYRERNEQRLRSRRMDLRG